MSGTVTSGSQDCDVFQRERANDNIQRKKSWEGSLLSAPLLEKRVLRPLHFKQATVSYETKMSSDIQEAEKSNNSKNWNNSVWRKEGSTMCKVSHI